MRLRHSATRGSDTVENLWVKEPDQSRWYRGEKDLSAGVWLREDGERLVLLIAVIDDKHTAGDGAQLVVADEVGKVLFTATGAELKSVRREADARTFYQVSLPKTAVQERPFRVSVQVNDDDGGYLKQVMKLGRVDEPAKGRRAIGR